MEECFSHALLGRGAFDESSRGETRATRILVRPHFQLELGVVASSPQGRTVRDANALYRI